VTREAAFSPTSGDVNQDGKTDVRDLIRLRDLTLRRGAPATAAEIGAGDLNGDGRLDARDLDSLRRLLLRGGIPDEGPAPGASPPLGAPPTSFAPSKDGVANALGLSTSDIEDFGFVAISGADTTASVASALVDSVAGGILLSTGLAADGGAGDTDLIADGFADSTTFHLTLHVPPGMNSLVYSSLFNTSEFSGGTANPDWADVAFSTGAPSLVLARVGSVSASYPWQVRAVDVSGRPSVTLTFRVADGLDGRKDSGLRLSHFGFTASQVITAGALASALLSDPGLGSPVDPSLQATSGAVQIVDVLSARRGSYSGSVLLTTGLESDRGLGSTDLAGDGRPDATTFSVGLQVPQDGKIKSLVFTSQFLSSEMDEIPAQRGSDLAGLHYVRIPSGSGDLDLGRVQSSSSVEQPPVTRAVDVQGATQVRLTFSLSDSSDQGRRDSGLLISGLYFSEYEADLLAKPRPADAKLNTGTYAYSTTLLAASGSQLPFGFMIHYDSAPRRTSGQMGPRWGHSYDWGVTRLESGDLDVRRGDGGVESFESAPGGGYIPSHGRIVNSIRKLADGSYLYETTSQMQYAFDSNGKLVAISDPNGNRVELHYGADGLLSDLVDSRSQTAAFGYDTNKLLTAVQYASRQIRLHYNSGKDVESFTDPAGNETKFTYDGDHNLLTGTDANGIQFVTNTYDDRHRVLEQLDGKGARSVNTYTSAKATRVDRAGNPVVTEFDPLDRAVAMTDGRGGVRRYSYDGNDNRTSETDPLGAISHSTYDEHGNLAEDQDPLGGLVKSIYDPGNRPVEVQDQAGQRKTNVYDANGNLLRTTNPLGFGSSFTYGPRGLLDRSTDRNGNVTQFSYTPAGDLATTTDALGGVRRSTYDELGRVVASYDANGNATFFTFDEAGRVTAVKDALGAVQGMTYDPVGRLLTETDPLGTSSHYRYSPTGELTEIEDASGASTRFEYDGEEDLVAAVDPLGRRTSYSYDANLRLESTVDALGGRVSTTSDSANNLISVTDPNGQTARFDFDSMGRCVAETDPLGGRVTNTYDIRGRIASTTNARGQTIRCDYDNAARMAAIHLPGHDVTLVLDANGNRVATAGSDGRRSERAYDPLNRLVRFTDVYGNTIRYQYDAVGNMTALTYSDGATVHYAYDALHRMTGVTDWAGRTTSYQYDAAGHVVAARLPDGSGIAYQYDAAGRLLSMSDTAPTGRITFGTRYTLGPSGLRMAEEATLPLEPPVTTGERNFRHNAANQIVAEGSEGFSYDADGNMTHGVVGRVPVDLAFDEMNRLVSVSGSRYEYDDDGLRTRASVNGWNVRYVQDPSSDLSRVLEEHDERGRIVARYVYGLGLISRHQMGHEDWRRVAPNAVDEDLLGSPDSDGGNKGHAEKDRGNDSDEGHGRRDRDDDSEEQVSVYHFDSRGSTVALTNLRGRITDRYAYDPFGLIVARDGDTPNPYTYDGRDGVVDDGNGLYFMRSRYYEPRLMRFVSRDGVVLGSVTDTQSLNRYAFVLNNPIHAVDPDGRWFGLDDLFMAIGGAIVNVAAQFVSDIISGEWSGWEAYAGAAAGGAVWGETLLYTANPYIAGAAGGAVGNALTQGLELATGKRESFDVLSFSLETGVGAAFGGLPFGKGAGKAASRGASQMLKYVGKSWASRGLTSSCKAAWQYASKLLVEEIITSPLQQFLPDLLTSPTAASGGTQPNPIRPESAIWARMLEAGRSVSTRLVGTVRPEMLLPIYAPITATEGGR
jgi:RHS repeat-associated protein